MGPILVLADHQDFLATRVMAALRNARLSVRVLTPLELSLGSAWTTHGVDGNDIERDVRPKAALGKPRAVLNRLHAARFFPQDVWSTTDGSVYAEAQFSALVASWLARLRCPVLGPTSGGLLYQNLGVVDWLAAAKESWLPTRSITLAAATTVTSDRGSLTLNASAHAAPTLTEARVSSPVVIAEPVTTMRPVYVVAGRVVGAPDDSLIPGVQRLADRSGCNLLECHFGWSATTPGRWVFCDASAVPMDAPAALLDAIVAALARK